MPQLIVALLVGLWALLSWTAVRPYAVHRIVVRVLMVPLVLGQSPSWVNYAAKIGRAPQPPPWKRLWAFWRLVCIIIRRPMWAYYACLPAEPGEPAKTLDGIRYRDRHQLAGPRRCNSRFNREHDLPFGWAHHPRPLGDKPDQVRSIMAQFAGAQKIKILRKPKHRPTHRKWKPPREHVLQVLWKPFNRGVPWHMANGRPTRRRTWKTTVAELVALVLLALPIGVGWAAQQAAATKPARVAFVSAPPVVPAGIPADEWKVPVGTVTTEVASWAKRATTGNDDITIATNLSATGGIGVVIFWWGGAGAVSGTADNGIAAGIGYASSNAGTVVQYADGITSDNGAGTSNTARRFATKALTLPTTTGGGEQWSADLSFTSATNMRLAFTVSSGSDTTRINYFIIGGLTGAKAIAWTLPAALGSAAVTGAGFTPELVFHSNTNQNATGSSGVESDISFGVMNKQGQQWANSAGAQDAVVGGSNTSRWQQTDACIAQTTPGETTTLQGHFQSMDADGFHVYFSTCSGWNGYYVVSLCLAGLSSKIGSFIENASPLAVTWANNASQGGTIRGMMMTSIAAGAQSAPTTNMFHAMGASDGTNSRAADIWDKDNAATTVTQSIWYNDAVLDIPQAFNLTAPTKLTVAFTSTTQFTTTNSGATSSEEILYLIIFDSGTNTWPNTILDTNNVNSNATGYSTQKHVAVLPSGRQIMVAGNNLNGADLYWSDTGLAGSWTSYANPVGGWLDGSIDTYTDSGGTQRIAVAWKQSGVSGTGPTGGARTTNIIYVAVGSLNGAATTITWGAYAEAGGAGYDTGNYASIDYPDVVAHAEGGSTGGQLHVVYGLANASVQRIRFHTTPVTANTTGAWTTTSMNGDAAGLINPFPSLCLDPATKRLFLTFTQGGTGAGKGVRFRTAPYSVGTWTFATEVEVDNTVYTLDAGHWVKCMWYAAGSIVYIAGQVYTGAAERRMLYESTNFTSFTQDFLTATTNATDSCIVGNAAVDAGTGDVHFAGRMYGGSGSAGADVVFTRKWTRATTTMGSVVITDSEYPPVAGGYGGYVYAWYQSSDQSIRWIYARGNNSPYAIAEDMIPVASGNTHQLINAA